MEKLELKHLAAYLPYGLKIKGEQFIHTMVIDMMTVTTKEIGIWFLLNSKIQSLKLMLRPLSDLNNLKNEINLHSINMLIGRNGVYGDIEVELCNGEIIFVTESDPFSTYDRAKEIDLNVFQTVMNELMKGHFDVFGLIDKDLAIDINTIEP